MKTLYWLCTSLALVLVGHLAPAQSALTFTALAALPVAHYGMGYCNNADYLYQAGGGSASTAYTGDVYRYDLGHNIWTASSAMVTPQRFGTAALIDPSPTFGVIYALNGQGSSGPPVPTMEAVRVIDGFVSPGGLNPQPTISAGSATWNGVLYCFGGYNGSTFFNALRAYTPQTDTWTTLAPMPEAKSTCGVAVNGKIYTFGGYNGVVNSSRVDVYDIATNQWQALGNLPTTVSNQAMAVQGTLIWMVGDFNNQSYLAAYNTLTNQLRTFTSNLPPRRNAAAAVVADQLYVWGGNTASANTSALADMWRASVAGVVTGTLLASTQPVLQAYPNPLEGSRLRVLLPSAAATVLTVCDAQGREVYQRRCPPGTSNTDLDLAGQAAGLYLVRAEAAGQPLAICRLVRR